MLSRIKSTISFTLFFLLLVTTNALGQNLLGADQKIWEVNKVTIDGVEGINLIKYIGPEIEEISTPSFIGGEKVISICYKNKSLKGLFGQSTFDRNTKIKKISVYGLHMKVIGPYSFAYLENSTIRIQVISTVEEIGKYAFSESNLFKFNFPTSLKVLGSAVFNQCSKLAYISPLPIGVTHIPPFAFDECKQLSVQINSFLHDELVEIGEYAFYNCTSLEGNVVFGPKIQSIKNAAFGGCSLLKGDLILPNSLTELGDYAFWNCKGLDGKLVLSDNIKSIGTDAFCRCNFNGDLVIPAAVTKIGNEAFYECSNLKGTLTFKGDVVAIGDRAFEGSSFTGTLDLPPTLTSLGRYAFYACDGFTGDLKIPDGITTIKQGCFSGCSGLNGSLYLSANLEYIESNAFYSCEGFRNKLLYPESLRFIGKHAFYGCKGFNPGSQLPVRITSIESNCFQGSFLYRKKLVIPEGVRMIAVSAFEYDIWGIGRDITELTLPSTLREIGQKAFWGTSGILKSITLNSENPPIFSDIVGNYYSKEDLKTIKVFSGGAYKKAIVMVPSTALDVYKADPFWGRFKNIQALVATSNTSNKVDKSCQIIWNAPFYKIHSKKAIEYIDYYNVMGQKMQRIYPSDNLILLKKQHQSMGLIRVTYKDGTQNVQKIM
ncbi:leucine-rich repeat domain-containing protein [Halosquirtibacter laminarini]|uniref:Leucine-rich repeat domain-containing protein n=1 Tax=Halosquirtibacter laminarini TaxID=3374600 RepID=A0AC61NL21_9BACT|nr:leucine-rich repeat domain-containing protein [Prolixibacteraceae bacterium]